jgi:hypothetical protein
MSLAKKIIPQISNTQNSFGRLRVWGIYLVWENYDLGFARRQLCQKNGHFGWLGLK